MSALKRKRVDSDGDRTAGESKRPRSEQAKDDEEKETYDDYYRVSPNLPAVWFSVNGTRLPVLSLAELYQRISTASDSQLSAFELPLVSTPTPLRTRVRRLFNAYKDSEPRRLVFHSTAIENMIPGATSCLRSMAYSCVQYATLCAARDAENVKRTYWEGLLDAMQTSRVLPLPPPLSRAPSLHNTVVIHKPLVRHDAVFDLPWLSNLSYVIKADRFVDTRGHASIERLYYSAFSYEVVQVREAPLPPSDGETLSHIQHKLYRLVFEIPEQVFYGEVDFEEAPAVRHPVTFTLSGVLVLYAMNEETLLVINSAASRSSRCTIINSDGVKIDPTDTKDYRLTICGRGWVPFGHPRPSDDGDPNCVRHSCPWWTRRLLEKRFGIKPLSDIVCGYLAI